MRKLGITLQSLGMIGALGVVLTGCPVWSSEDFDDRPPTVRDGGVVTDGGGGGRCTTDGQCAGGFCDRASGTCTPLDPLLRDHRLPGGAVLRRAERVRPWLYHRGELRLARGGLRLRHRDAPLRPAGTVHHGRAVRRDALAPGVPRRRLPAAHEPVPV
jgi:hypothetical protein